MFGAADSELLFEIMWFQISKLCNQSTHDKVAPTKQNLICRGKSAIEVIKMQVPQEDEIGLEPPSVTFVQKTAASHQLVIILDNGPQMTAENWSLLRTGLEQMMLIMPKTRQLTAIIGEQIFGPRVIDQGNNDRFWETVVFSPTLETSAKKFDSQCVIYFL